jgi:hypothetical protein
MAWCLIKHRGNFAFTFTPEWKRELGRPWSRWKNIKIDLKEGRCENVDSISVSQWRALVNMVVDFLVP